MIKTDIVNGIIIASLPEVSRFNALNSEPVKEELKSLFTAPNTKLIFDLQGVAFIDSSGFGVFLSIMKTANNSYGYFKICNICEEVMEIFKLLQLHNIFEIYKTREDALNSFR